MAAILQLSQYCTFRMDSISTVITEPGQPVSHHVRQGHHSLQRCPWSEGLKDRQKDAEEKGLDDEGET